MNPVEYEQLDGGMRLRINENSSAEVEQYQFLCPDVRSKRNPDPISIGVVDYLVERLEKVSPKVPSVIVVPFVPGG
jgi:hypothetical protein